MADGLFVRKQAHGWTHLSARINMEELLIIKLKCFMLLSQHHTHTQYSQHRLQIHHIPDQD